MLVDRSSGEEVKAWPVKYSTMFHMTNDSGLFRTRSELEEKEGAWPVGGNRFQSPSGEWVPLYEGKMVQAFDHRAASIVINPKNLHRPAQPKPATIEQHARPELAAGPAVLGASVARCALAFDSPVWVVGFKDDHRADQRPDVHRRANSRLSGFGNKVPVVDSRTGASELQRMRCSRPISTQTVFDFVTRQKVQGQTSESGSFVEQLPVVPFGAVPHREFRTQDGGGDRPRGRARTHLHGARHETRFAREMGHVDEGRTRSSRHSAGMPSAALTCAPSWTRSTSTSTA